MSRPLPRSDSPPDPPAGFRIRRDLPLGRHPLLEAFPGLERLPTALRQVPGADARRRRYRGTFVEILPQDLWMYVAPRQRLTSLRRGRFDPLLAPEADVIVIGEGHFRESPALTVFLDIFHELCHLAQRDRGLELFDRAESYVRRPTELEAYRFVVDEARRLRVGDAYLRDYLRVEWISPEEFAELLDAMGVSGA